VIDRRAVLSGLGAGLLAMPLALDAQPAGKVYRIGILHETTEFDLNADPNERALIDGLRQHGYVAGKNLVVQFRSAYGKRERLPELAVELVRIPVDLILVLGTGQARAAKQATATIPIVFGALPSDPVQAGLVESLARQGREAGRPPGRRADRLRSGDQPQDREGPRAHDPAIDARTGG